MCGDAVEGHKVIGKRMNQSQGKNPKYKIGISTTVCKCTNCGLVYSNPQPIPFDIQDHYGVPPEDYWVDNYFEINDNYFKYEINRLKELMDIQPGMTSLDIGSGLGMQMKAMESIGFEAYGFEPSLPFYERTISKMGISPDKVKNEMMEDVEYEDEFFDFISFGVVLEHIYDPSEAIEKVLKWLKPNGLIHIEVPSSEWLVNKLINLFYKLKGEGYVANLSPMHAPFHLYEFNLESFKKNSAINHYEIVFHEYFLCSTFMPKVLDGIIKPYMKKTDSGMQLCVWLQKK